MSAQHTPGLLHVCGHGINVIRDANGKWVADVRSVLRPHEEDQANASRFVACWNAFAGISTEIVEATIGTGAMQAACDSMAALPAVRQELAAARALLREVVSEVDQIGEYPRLRDQIRSYLDACDVMGGGAT